MTKYIDKNGVEIDVSGLPKELLAELKIIPDDLDCFIFNLLPVDGSGMSLDQILVDLYKKHGILKKRRFMQNKIHRMKNVASKADRNGIYSRHPALVDVDPPSPHAPEGEMPAQTKNPAKKSSWRVL